MRPPPPQKSNAIPPAAHSVPEDEPKRFAQVIQMLPPAPERWFETSGDITVTVPLTVRLPTTFKRTKPPPTLLSEPEPQFVGQESEP